MGGTKLIPKNAQELHVDPMQCTIILNKLLKEQKESHAVYDRYFMV